MIYQMAFQTGNPNVFMTVLRIPTLPLVSQETSSLAPALLFNKAGPALRSFQFPSETGPSAGRPRILISMLWLDRDNRTRKVLFLLPVIFQQLWSSTLVLDRRSTSTISLVIQSSRNQITTTGTSSSRTLSTCCVPWATVLMRPTVMRCLSRSRTCLKRGKLVIKIPCAEVPRST